MNLEELKSLAKKLPDYEPSAERSAQLRASLMASLTSERGQGARDSEAEGGVSISQLQALAKQLSEHRPTISRSEELRESLLAGVQQQGASMRVRSHAWRPLAALAMVAGLAFYVGVRKGESQGARVASAKASLPLAAPAQVAEVQTTSPALAVALAKGKVVVPLRKELPWRDGRLDVDTSKSGFENVAIRTSNASVLALSSEDGIPLDSVFFVDSVGDKLRDVHVLSGRVQVRIIDQAAVVLGPGQSLLQQLKVQRELLVTSSDESLPEDTVPETSPAAGALVAKRIRSPRHSSGSARRIRGMREKAKRESVNQNTSEDPPSPEVSTTSGDTPESVSPNTNSPASREPGSGELAFASGYRAVRRGDYGRAILDLDMAIAKGSSQALKSDSRYWRLVALARSGHQSEAARAMADYLRFHGGSARAAEVATMLGWIFVEEGKTKRAGRLFGKGAADPSAAVRASAQKGLQVLAECCQ